MIRLLLITFSRSLSRSLSLSLRFACRVVLVFSKNRIDLRIAVLLCTWPRGKFDVFFSNNYVNAI